MDLQLSILVASVWRRGDLLHRLLQCLEPQIYEQPVELLYLGDNRRRTLGAKRDNLLKLSQGKYVTFVDDDDLVAENYVSAILDVIHQEPHVISWNMEVLHDGVFSRHEPFCINTYYGALQSPKYSLAHHTTAAWLGTWARQVPFSHVNFGEDYEWSRSLVRKIKTQSKSLLEVHIDESLYIWDHNSKRTESLLENHDSYCCMP